MNELDFLLRLAVSLAIGGLIGLEREQHRDHELVIAGVRTFPLVSLSGAIFSFLATDLKIAAAVEIGMALFGAIAMAYIYIRHELKLSGMTSPIAILVTYIIGVLIGYGHFVEGVSVGVATTFILLAKNKSHEFAMAVTQADMMGALQFILVAFILYPVTLHMGPVIFNGFNVSEIINLSTVVLTVTLVSLISFISFLAIHYFGTSKGLPFSGALGGLVNSEAATASLAAYTCKNKKLARHALSGIVLANTGMLARNLIISGLSDTSFKTAIVMFIPCIVMGEISFFYFTWANRRRETKGTENVTIASPFGMKPGLILGLLISITSGMVFLLSKNTSSIGEWSIYFTALIGLVSSGAVVFSVSTLAFTGQITPLMAGEVATIACLISTLNKIIIMRSESEVVTKRGWWVFAGLLVAGVVSFAAVDLYLRSLGWS